MSWNSFISGFLAGFIANQVFAMLTRALPGKLVRYKVRIGEVETRHELTGRTWIVPITISSPRWYQHMLMSPLNEYLCVDVKPDDKDWVMTEWDKGDVSETMLRADGEMTISATVLSLVNSTLYLNSGVFREKAIITQGKILSVRVVRSVDRKPADIVSFPFSISNGIARFGQGKRNPKSQEIQKPAL